MEYWPESEEVYFLCLNCYPNYFTTENRTNELPKGEKWKFNHECFKCKRKFKLGHMEYCTRCEAVHFLCLKCYTKYVEAETRTKEDPYLVNFSTNTKKELR